jgi:hypothetical protein
MHKYVTSEMVSSALGISIEDVQELAVKEDWIAKEDYECWIDTLREAKKLHEQEVPYFIIWLSIIQMIEGRAITADVLMDLIRDTELCIIKDE